MNELIDIANSRQNAADYFVSPYRQISHIGDPYVLYDEASGKYYMYCTGGKFRCWSSDTFKSWTELGDAYTETEKSFGTQNYWAPEVYKWNGAYYMVYSAARKVEGSLSSTGLRHSIGLAKADNPAGPSPMCTTIRCLRRTTASSTQACSLMTTAKSISSTPATAPRMW